MLHQLKLYLFVLIFNKIFRLGLKCCVVDELSDIKKGDKYAES